MAIDPSEKEATAVPDDPAIREITYPGNATQRIADWLQDWDWNLTGDDAMERARTIVIEVTDAVDKLRAQEAAGA